MALTLECFCPDDPNVAGCELVGMKWHIEINNQMSPNGKTAIATATLTTSGDSHTVSNTTPNTISIDEITLDPLIWVPNWFSATITIGNDSSLLQVPANDHGATGQFTWWISLSYNCQNPVAGGHTSKEIFAIDTTKDSEECVVGGIPRGIATSGFGSGFAVLLESTPLGPCNGATSTTTNFNPYPANGTVASTTDGQWCLCASGGIGPYAYAVVTGRLPSGQTLNEATGCVEGTPDGKDGGSGIIKFQVTDQSADVATVSCNLVAICPGLVFENVGY